MKTVLVLFFLCGPVASSFVSQPKVSRCPLPLQVGYVPDGLSSDEYRKLKAKESKSKENKNLGAYGPNSFKSRSLKAFQQDLEKGKAGHLMPMFNAKEKIKNGRIKQEDIPYMQRGGSWDNTDVKGAKKKKWSSADKNYNEKWQPAKFDWSGHGLRQGPATANNNNKKGKPDPQKPQVKKLFGLF